MNGIQPTCIGKLPEQLAAYNRTNINVQMLAVAAVLEHRKEHVYHAIMMDPLCRSMLNLDQMYNMADELFAEEADMIPYFN
jgi:alpha-galactosidase